LTSGSNQQTDRAEGTGTGTGIARTASRAAAIKDKKYDYEPKEGYLAFAAALKRHRHGSGYPTQARLGVALGVSWHTVGSWEKAIWAPSPEKVFAIERILALPPGALSRHLGYLPLVGSSASVMSAIDSDPWLDEQAKGLLTEIYRSFVQKGAARSE
jgi:DNA-binding XRE family transcriptional regulator